MGVVFKARQISLNRIVALKFIHPGRLESTEAIRRFRNEAETTARLDHPNIVPIHEIGEHEGHHYFAMKFIEGGSLAMRGEGGGVSGEPDKPLHPRTSPLVLQKVARAVHYAHQRGILHRDLKPGNILLDAE